MKAGIQGIGWFLRRSRDPIRLGAFYERALGLPRLRSWDTQDSTGVMLWAGHTAVLETNRLSAQSVVNQTASQLIPVFRTEDLGHAERDLAEAGSQAVERDRDARAATSLFADPDGNLFGVEQVDSSSARAHDAALPGTCLPGEIRMGRTITGLSRVIHKTPDVAAEKAFLRGLGLRDVEQPGATCRLDLGGNCILELEPGGDTLPRIGERTMMTDAWLLRVYGIERLRDRLSSLGRHGLSQHEFPGGWLDYVLTPTNRLIGWQERKPYDPDIMTTQLIEDLYARGLWCRTVQNDA